MNDKLKELLTMLEEAANNYDETEYCECGCKGRSDWGHNNVGQQRFASIVQQLTPHAVIHLMCYIRQLEAENVRLRLIDSVKEQIQQNDKKLREIIAMLDVSENEE